MMTLKEAIGHPSHSKAHQSHYKLHGMEIYTQIIHATFLTHEFHEVIQSDT